MNIMGKPKNSRDLKVSNYLLVRDAIREKGPIARNELAEETGLTPPTISVIVKNLIEEEVVVETGYGESSGGRRPVMLELNSHAAYVFAITLQKWDLAMAVLDLSGKILNQQRQALENDKIENVVEIIGGYLDWLTNNGIIDRNKVLWTAVAFSGLVDENKEFVIKSTNLNWEYVPLAEMLTDRLGGIPVELEKNSNAAALAEMVYGKGSNYSSLVYINLSVGISAGIVINGKIYSGEYGYAGELGHTTLCLDDGSRCNGVRYGYLEAVCGVQNVIRRIKDEVPENIFIDLGVEKSKLTINKLNSSPLLEVIEVQSILRQTGKMVGIAIANLLSLFNVPMVILGGELASTGDILTDSIISTVKKRTLKEIAESVNIVKTEMNEDPQLMGAYALVLEKIFSVENWGL